jgi:hypothetical protein
LSKGSAKYIALMTVSLVILLLGIFLVAYFLVWPIIALFVYSDSFLIDLIDVWGEFILIPVFIPLVLGAIGLKSSYNKYMGKVEPVKEAEIKPEFKAGKPQEKPTQEVKYCPNCGSNLDQFGYCNNCHGYPV